MADNDGGEKRNRANNYSKFETEMLVDITSKAEFNKILENKETNGNNNNKKNETWKQVCETFNSYQGVSKRTPKQLRTHYDNIKRKAKKFKAADRREHFATGGGPRKAQKLDATTEKVLDLIRDQVEPLRNPYDSDAVFHYDNCFFESTEKDIQLETDLETQSVVEDEPQDEQISVMEVSQFDLEPQISNDIERVVKESTPNNGNRTTPSWISRNRPSLKAVPKSEAAKARQSIGNLAAERQRNLVADRQFSKERQQKEMEILALQKQTAEIERDNTLIKSKILAAKLAYYTEKFKCL